MRGHYADNVKPRATTTRKAYFDMDAWLFFLAGMTVMCGCAAILAAFADWLQKKLDESNEEQDQELNNEQQ